MTVEYTHNYFVHNGQRHIAILDDDGALVPKAALLYARDQLKQAFPLVVDLHGLTHGQLAKHCENIEEPWNKPDQSFIEPKNTPHMLDIRVALWQLDVPACADIGFIIRNAMRIHNPEQTLYFSGEKNFAIEFELAHMAKAEVRRLPYAGDSDKIAKILSEEDGYIIANNTSGILNRSKMGTHIQEDSAWEAWCVTGAEFYQWNGGNMSWQDMAYQKRTLRQMEWLFDTIEANLYGALKTNTITPPKGYTPLYTPSGNKVED